MRRCACGCGLPTPIAGQTSKRFGHVQGEQVRFVRGHNLRAFRSVASYRHGHTIGGRLSPTYSSWRAMMQRCQNPNAADWALYGGRGITVCERWLAFAAFLADLGERPTGKTLDRIDPDGHYEPGNCRWATPMEQRHNRRARSNGGL